jgi:hypothetical protein
MATTTGTVTEERAMADTNAKNAGAGASRQAPDASPITLLEKIRSRGRAWEDLAVQYGVTNPDPPWKVSMFSTCEALAVHDCLETLDRRASEDDLSETLYRDIPQPERQLMALAHTMIRRGLVDEEELERRMRQVHERLTSA